MTANGGQLAIFDVCNTLYRANTTFDFVRFHLRRRPVARSILQMITSRLSPLRWGLAVHHRFLHLDFSRWLVLRLLSGRPQDILRSDARKFVTSVLQYAANAELLERLRQHQRAGDRVVLVSGSLDFVVEAIAETLGVEWRASTTRFRNGRFSGHLSDDLTARKHKTVEILARSFALRPRLVVYTDNISDRALVESADEAYIVLPPGGDRSVWGDVRANYITIGP